MATKKTKTRVKKPAPNIVEVEEVVDDRDEEEVVLRDLTRAEQLYINEKIGTTTPQRIAEDLGISVELIIANVPKKFRSKMQEMMSSQRKNVKKFGTKVMTEAASEWAEEMRRINKARNPSEGPHIFKPYGNDSHE
jgi:hypothetical protein